VIEGEVATLPEGDDSGWARVVLDKARYDLCPACWQEMWGIEQDESGDIKVINYPPIAEPRETYRRPGMALFPELKPSVHGTRGGCGARLGRG